MRLLPHSLRMKLALGYLTWLLIMVGIVSVTWRDIFTVEKMVRSGEMVTDLFDTALEVRRFEKNYLLYGGEENFRELLHYLGKMEGNIDAHRRVHELYAAPEHVAKLRGALTAYRETLEQAAPDMSVYFKKAWEIRLREQGKAIVALTEDVARGERQRMESTLQASRRLLLASTGIVMLAVFVMGNIYYRMFIRPLRHLEDHLNRIAGGEFSMIPVASRDREMVSLSRAFNRMLNELEWRQEHVVRSEKLASLGTMLFGVTHELNNPLSNISTSAQILREEIDGQDRAFQRELLAQIEEETERARDIISSVLGFSRNGRIETFSLKDAVGDTVRFIKSEVPARVALSVDVPPEIVMKFDRQRLQHVLLNLIKNSLDAMPDAGGEIAVEGREGEAQIDLIVRDTGAGMEPEVMKKIFDPFFTTKEKKRGYGLGLFIVHQIVKDMGGRVHVESAPGRGTEFHIALPRVQREAEGEAHVDVDQR